MAIYLRPWFETTLNIWHGYHYLLFFAGSPVVSESPKLHKPLSREEDGSSAGLISHASPSSNLGLAMILVRFLFPLYHKYNMEENKNKCLFCNKVFENVRKRVCHQRLCELNPDREKMLNALRKGGSITFKKINKERTLERKEFICKCLKCRKEYSVICTENDYNKGNYRKYCCSSCANSRKISEEQKYKVSEKLKKAKEIKQCKSCKINISYKNKSGYCKNCIYKFKTISDETREKLHLAGLKSCNIQAAQRRSKNEIAFCELCEKQFKTVKHNEAIFNGWDADIIIEDLKVAILWNGKWHYEKIKENHSIEQVQNRDNIKIEEIKKCGYIPYIIKDLGKYNLEKVNSEFKLFLKNMGLQN